MWALPKKTKISKNWNGGGGSSHCFRCISPNSGSFMAGIKKKLGPEGWTHRPVHQFFRGN